MLELLWLLLPVAAASGWYAGRRRREPARAPARPVPTEYFKGLNYLLNEQPDKAIEVFVRMVEVDSETVETHFALGHLFRRRGEVDRAIRIHQNLIARPTLTPEQRAQALLALGEDYMRAGLFDRAENLFAELVESGAHTVPALRHLIDIYQQEKDWEKAIDACRRLQVATGRSMAPVIAHYHCEMAEQARRAGDPARARQLLRRALSQDPACVRASILLGDLEAGGGNLRAALKAWRRVVEQDVEYLPEIVERVASAHRGLDDPEGYERWLREVMRRYEGISPMLALAEHLRQRAGDRAAADFLADQLRRRPSVRGLARLIDLRLDQTSGEAREQMLILRDLVGKLLEGRPVYKCRVCGFEGKQLHWQCPSCKGWSTVKPIRGVEGE